MSAEYDLIVENDGVPFCESTCTCEVCTDMNKASEGGGNFTPINNRGRRIQEVIRRILERESAKAQDN